MQILPDYCIAAGSKLKVCTSNLKVKGMIEEIGGHLYVEITNRE